MSHFLAVSNICCVTRIKFWNFEADDQYKKNRLALNLVVFCCFFWSDYVFKFKNRLLNLCFVQQVHHWMFSECLLHGFLFIQQLFPTTQPKSLHETTSLTLRKLKLLNTTQFISDKLILSGHTFVLKQLLCNQCYFLSFILIFIFFTIM